MYKSHYSIATSTNTTTAAVDSLLARKIDNATAGLRPFLAKALCRLSEDNAGTITDYIQSLKEEINASNNYRRNVIAILCSFSEYNNKPFRQITREDILAFLDSFRRPESIDPQHKWIGTYNLYRVNLIRFFKWFLYPQIEPNKRANPKLLDNIQRLKRKEKSTYTPADIWTAEDDLLFLKYCPSKRTKCYHAMSHDTGCRPHELLKLKIKDIAFKTSGDKQYAEISINGKTGSRHIPLIDSIPYVKDYLDHEHPQPGNPNAVFLSGVRRSLGRSIDIITLHGIYKRYKTELFPRLLDDPNVLPEDKQRIRELLKKPWNPYVRRHSALTEKSKILKEHTLRQFAGWSTGSNMPQIYLHYFGNESCESLLEAYGITQKAVIIVIEHIMQLAYFYDEQLLYHIPSIVLFRAMNLKISLMLGISAVLALGVVASPLTISADAGMMYNHQQGIGYAAHYSMNKPGQYAAGTIASLQNDKDGKPAWIVSGLWKASSTNMTSEMPNIVSNASIKKNLPTAAFDAMFNMVMLNGSAMHKHEIHNFTLTGISMPNNKTVVYNGTVTITMKNGPVHGVPVSAKAMDANVISIWIDPTKTDNHFGNTPIYGTITKAVQIMK